MSGRHAAIIGVVLIGGFAAAGGGAEPGPRRDGEGPVRCPAAPAVGLGESSG
jgi:hypothetical protein